MSLAPAIARLLEREGFTRLAQDEVEAFCAAPGESVLFFTEDPSLIRETLDLAVILPELRNASPRPMRVGVLLPDVANALAATYAVRLWPALVYMRAGGYLGAIEALRTWAEYRRLNAELLSSEARPLPRKVIPVAAGAPGRCA